MGHSESISIGLLLFPSLTQLDLTGPYEVFVRAPGTTVHLIWKDLQPVMSDRGMAILPTTTLDTCPPLDIICIPGGPGQVGLMDDEDVLAFIRIQNQQARLITSVCTGSLLLGATPVSQRIVRDRNRITGAGVTSGIDFALYVVAELLGEAIARKVIAALPEHSGKYHPLRARLSLRHCHRTARGLTRRGSRRLRRVYAWPPDCTINTRLLFQQSHDLLIKIV